VQHLLRMQWTLLLDIWTVMVYQKIDRDTLLAGCGCWLRPFLENIFLEKFLEKFSRNSRNNNRNSNQVFFYTLVFWLLKWHLKFKQNWHLLKLMMKYYQKWAEFGKIWGKTNSKNVKNEVKIQKITLNRISRISQISRKLFLEKFEKNIILNFSRNFQDGRSLVDRFCKAIAV
jgi:hypothetical protein